MRDPNLVRKEMLPLDAVLPLVILPTADAPLESPGESLKMVNGDMINMNSPKLQTFAHHGVRCQTCGCVGEYFGKEKYPSIPFYHLNLYAMKNGRETQMLKEHKVAIDEGGLDVLENFRTVCFDCHKKRVNTPADLENRKRIRAKKRAANKAKKAAGEQKTKVGLKKPKK